MKISILEYLVCPSCRSKLKLKSKSKSKNEIYEGNLICTKCNDKFKISKGIPRFVVDITKDFISSLKKIGWKWVFNKSTMRKNLINILNDVSTI